MEGIVERFDNGSAVFLVLALACGVPLILLGLGAIWFFVFRASRTSAVKIAVSVACGFAGVVTLLSALVGVIVFAGEAVVAKYGPPPPTYISTPAPLYGAPYTPNDPVVVKYGPPPTEEPIQLMYGPPPTDEP